MYLVLIFFWVGWLYSYVDEPILENQSCFQGEGRGGGEVGEGERQREALANENQDCY